MSFTSVLQKIGTVILDGSEIASEVMGFPFITQLLGQVKVGTSGSTVATVATTATSDLNTMASIVSMMEVAFPSIAGAPTGSAKLAAATPLVQQALMTWATSNLPGHSAVKDPTLLTKASGEIAGGFADLLNSFGA